MDTVAQDATPIASRCPASVTVRLFATNILTKIKDAPAGNGIVPGRIPDFLVFIENSEETLVWHVLQPSPPRFVAVVILPAPLFGPTSR